MRARSNLFSLFRVLLVVAALGIAPAQAADPNDFEIWMPITAGGHFGNTNWLGFFEFQPRFGDNATSPDRMIVRPAIGRDLGSGFSTYLGYVYQPVFETSTFHYNWKNENRIYQELRAEHKLPNNWPLINRFRFEERFIDGAGEEPAYRTRYLMKTVVPIEGPWGVGVSDEFFFNLNSTPTGPKEGFDQNRAATTLVYKTTYGITYEAGYMNNWVHNQNKLDRQNHILLLSLAYKWD